MAKIKGKSPSRSKPRVLELVRSGNEVLVAIKPPGRPVSGWALHVDFNDLVQAVASLKSAAAKNQAGR